MKKIVIIHLRVPHKQKKKRKYNKIKKILEENKKIKKYKSGNKVYQNS